MRLVENSATARPRFAIEIESAHPELLPLRVELLVGEPKALELALDGALAPAPEAAFDK